MAEDRRRATTVIIGDRARRFFWPPLMRKASAFVYLSVVVTCFCCVIRVASCSSCSEAKLCCPGRDSSCVVQKTPMNVNVVTRDEDDDDEKPCYCDHACLKLGDCCVDFKQACNVADCVVSRWNEWSECDTNCGTGIMWRRRTVVKHPVNGGRHCPPLIQRRACLGTSCPQNPSSALKEIAMLLPTTSFSSRSTRLDRVGANETANRANGPSNLENVNEIAAQNHNRKLYCVLFKVVKATKACKKDSSFSILNEGEKVCVRCDSEAMRPSLGYRCSGHGTMDRSTSWSALSAPHCHGRWVRMPLDGSSSSSTSISSGSQFQHSIATVASCHLCPEGPQYVFV